MAESEIIRQEEIRLEIILDESFGREPAMRAMQDCCAALSAASLSSDRIKRALGKILLEIRNRNLFIVSEDQSYSFEQFLEDEILSNYNLSRHQIWGCLISAETKEEA